MAEGAAGSRSQFRYLAFGRTNSDLLDGDQSSCQKSFNDCRHILFADFQRRVVADVRDDSVARQRIAAQEIKNVSGDSRNHPEIAGVGIEDNLKLFVSPCRERPVTSALGR